ncbi:MAG: HlyD family efflux transporter periplasmic adaptor subunit [Sulfuritalea sp.]|jgi:hypothetical protein|nr:HlyD family efflux transporter periplasmic adaptor subunit [Sulfuritalea sp.]
MIDAQDDQNHSLSAGLTSLARLIHLARRSREAESVEQLGFIAVNETRDLAAYRQAVLWQDGHGALALSGVVSPDANTPYLLWLGRVMRRLASADFSAVRTVSAADLPDDEAAEWAEWLPARALWLPYRLQAQTGGWLLARDEPWDEAEIAVLTEWQALWCQAWALRLANTAHSFWHQAWTNLRNWRPTRAAMAELMGKLQQRTSWRILGHWLWHTQRGRITLGVLAVMLFPVRLSVLAPGQLVPANPAVIRSPLDGIVDQILVQPNQLVKAGTPLVEFDRISLNSRLEVARQTLATAEAEYRQFAQQAVTEAKSKGQMAMLQGRIEEKRAEAAYLDALNQRATLTAPRDGIALLDEPSEWVGRPVTTGERIMVVADEHEAEIEAWLPPGDLIELPALADVTIYLNTHPLSPVSGRLRYVAHEALLQPEGGYAYRLRAQLAADEKVPRVGLKGSVKVNGHFVPLLYWVLRKPLAVARGFLGI